MLSDQAAPPQKFLFQQQTQPIILPRSFDEIIILFLGLVLVTKPEIHAIDQEKQRPSTGNDCGKCMAFRLGPLKLFFFSDFDII